MTIRIGNKLEKTAEITVAPSGAQFTSVKDAIAAATGRTTIRVAPGIYTEDNPIQGKANVSVVADGNAQNTRITASNGSADLFTMADTFTLRRLALSGITSPAKYAVNFSVSGFASVVDCAFLDCSNGTLLNHASAVMNMQGCAFISPVQAVTRGIYVQAGNIIIDSLGAAVGTIADLVEVSGAGAIATINNLASFNSAIGTVLKVASSARVVVNSASFVAMTDGVEVQDGADLRMIGCSIFNAQTDGLRVNDVGSDTRVSLQGCNIEDSTQYDLNILSSTAVVSGTVQSSIDKLNIVSDAQIYVSIIDLKEADEGTKNLGEFAVGLPERPAESIFGGGDSYTRGMLVYTETPGGVFDDVSEDARSASSSTFTFPGVAADNAVYVASSLMNGDVLLHHGIKMSIDTAAVLGAGEIIAEYWNGAAWVELNGMVTDSDVPFLPYGKDYFSRTGGFQLRYDIIEMNAGNMVKNDPMVLGTDYFWVRYRVDTAVTTVPIFQQFKLHSNRSEANSDGFLEFFGNARPYTKLDMSFDTGKPVKGSMQDQSVWMDENIGVGHTKNKFTAVSDVYGWPLVLPNSADTSSKIAFRFAGVPNTAESITFTIRWAWQNPDGTMYLSEPAGGSNPSTQSTTVVKSVTANTLEWFEAFLDISDFIARRDTDFPDGAMITIQPTTMGGTFSGTMVQAYLLNWCSGGHADN